MRTHARTQAHTHARRMHTQNACRIAILSTQNACRKEAKMEDAQFLAFIAGTSTRGGATYNLQTQNVSKQARDVLAKTPYKTLAKAHIANKIVNAYKNNADFASKLEAVLTEYKIALIAPEAEADADADAEA